MIDVQSARRQMIEQQVRAWDVLDLRVLEAMERVPREEFVPAALSRPRLRRHERAARRRPVDARTESRGTHPAGTRRSSPPTARSKSAPAAAILPHAWARSRAPSHSIEICARDFAHAALANLQRHGAHNVTVEVVRRDDAGRDGEYDVIALTGSLPVYDARFERALKVGRAAVCRSVGTGPVMDARRVTRTGHGDMDRRRACSRRHGSARACPEPPRFVF